MHSSVYDCGLLEEIANSLSPPGLPRNLIPLIAEWYYVIVSFTIFFLHLSRSQSIGAHYTDIHYISLFTIRFALSC